MKYVLTVVATVLSIALLVAIWFVGYEEGWRQAIAKARSVVEGACTPPTGGQLRLRESASPADPAVAPEYASRLLLTGR
jgi:hypothetical protein